MKKVIFLTLSLIMFWFNAYANEYYLFVKYKDNVNNDTIKKNNLSLSSTGYYNYEIVKQLNKKTCIVKATNKPNYTESANDHNISQEEDLNRAYKVANNFMQQHPDVKYAIPHDSKLYIYDVGKNVHRWNEQWNMHSQGPDVGVHANEAWGFLDGKKLNETYVAVIDSG
ncbi:hypothetical protein IB642_05130 [Allofrancisella guangzhouensis]|uniref:Serine protease n=1 Tax=Allofrancisella guangzhouensis TaxID=594679 RepID=A0A0A8E3I9_9GAMM|nr:hypothetical protein [Allofrancisella guangzhouensis]AJC48795.1 hypothetical protein SD28_03675 [Allofrancisella guangzhouensis]MBK2028017.1 hypothetical protein [Allofrancisella guangzhouensis]MBK2044401.1 hypothetical protein [Allofrancisella guangzhouensis]MBK2045293.1 hypothetical protein [Allofrancisella guangzhouensis]